MPALLYCNFSGSHGLCTLDPSWSKLLEPDHTGFRGLTCSAIVKCTCRPAQFAEGGFRVIVGYDKESGHELYETQTESDVVCFVSSAASAGACRSLIETDDGVYRLPPFATVTLLAVHAPGEWAVQGPYVSEALRAEDRIVQRRCFEVSVAF